MGYTFYLITYLGDPALLAPASAVLLAYLVYLRSTRVAAFWASTLALCAAITLLLKLCFYGCGAGLPAIGILSPSGHTSIGTTFYGCCALMLSAEKARWERLVLLLGSVALVIAIAMSRVILQAHTLNEVILGLSVGALCVAWFGRRYFALARPPVPWQPILVTLFVVALVTHGQHWDVEGIIGHIARIVDARLPLCTLEG
jgi:membrane-associated phospholipid phosphatase